MNQRWTLVVALLLLGSIVLVGVGGAAEEPSSDSTVTNINVREDGSAEWTIEVRTALESESDVEEYEAFMSDFNNNSSAELDSFETRMTTVVAEANESTEREMTAHNFSAEADIEGYTSQYGVTRFTFVWDNFASVEGSTIQIGDAFEGELFIGENEYLRVQAPEGYAIDTATPSPDTQSTSDSREYALWGGPYEFADGEPMIQASETSGDTNGTEQGPNDEPEDITNYQWILALLIGAIVISGLGVYVWAQFSDSDPDTSADDTGSSADTSLVTDEERVLDLLDPEERVKQTEIRDELGWSDSKTSRVLSNLEDDGKVEKLRLGRENVVRRTDDITE